MAVTEANTHPFAGDGIALAHNGFFTPRAAVDALLPDAGTGCAGDTDSERYFALVRDRLAAAGSAAGRPGRTPPHLALRDAGAAISGVAEVESLNALLLTPDALYAYARYEPAVVAARGGDAALLRHGLPGRPHRRRRLARRRRLERLGAAVAGVAPAAERQRPRGHPRRRRPGARLRRLAARRVSPA